MNYAVNLSGYEVKFSATFLAEKDGYYCRLHNSEYHDSEYTSGRGRTKKEALFVALDNDTTIEEELRATRFDWDDDVRVESNDEEIKEYINSLIERSHLTMEYEEYKECTDDNRGRMLAWWALSK
jgi:hypothetical protein